MRILIAIDGSVHAMTAMRTTVRLLREDENQFDLLCVAPDFYFPPKRPKKDAKKSAQIVEAYRERIRAEALQMLNRTQAAWATEGGQANVRVELGSPARVISQLASEYDLTVVGAHDKQSRTKPGLGPVASRVVAAAPGAVLVGRELSEGRNWRILAAVDGSLASEHALNLMALHLRTASAEITLMHVIETPWIHLGLEREWFDYPRVEIDRAESGLEYDLEHEMEHEASLVIEQSRDVLEGYGLSANTITAEGDPALEILSEVEKGEYDLVVIGATSQSDLKHHMLGSVSTKIAQDAPCSVFVAKFIE